MMIPTMIPPRPAKTIDQTAFHGTPRIGTVVQFMLVSANT